MRAKQSATLVAILVAACCLASAGSAVADPTDSPTPPPGPAALGPLPGPAAVGPAPGPVAGGPLPGPAAAAPSSGTAAAAIGPLPTTAIGPSPGPAATGPSPGPAATGPAPGPAVIGSGADGPPPGPAAVAATGIDHDGTFAVGTDIAPGAYSSAGPVEGDVCYWKRIGGADGTATIDNAMTKKPQVVQIDPADKAFKTSGCQPWQPTTAPPPSLLAGPLPALVGGAKLRVMIDDVNRRAAESGQGQLPGY